MAGIYIHIPFCRSKCHYCNFVSVASVKNKSAYINALMQETAVQASFLSETDLVETIYFGGGTPSLLSVSEVENLLHQISAHFRLADNPEITFEMNPDDAAAEFLRELKLAGVNRLSLGIQSFHNEELLFLGRKHTAQTGILSYLKARDADFKNISIDLIFGLPAKYSGNAERNISSALKLDPEHISAYCLTLEERTIMWHLVSKNKMSPPDDELAAKQFLVYMHRLKGAGYEHYEISNYAKPGYRSKHNSGYWNNRKYLGLGAGAHSYDLNSRWWNTSLISEYISGIMNGNPARETEVLSETDKYNEYVMTAVRTSEGIEGKHIESMFGRYYSEHFQNAVSKHLQNGNIICNENRYILTDAGKLRADSAASDLML